ncbi:MAG: NAD(P)/FAD-dependent oxidoreductase, partial [Methyloglobulus sp.]|nr:NAD(P)/FAD-dependent oxidoreductase [Methyloglobulus sp.]
MAAQHFTLLIVGGGAAGVSVANNMRRQNPTITIGLIEPSEKHYYQPGFTIIGGGTY